MVVVVSLKYMPSRSTPASFKGCNNSTGKSPPALVTIPVAYLEMGYMCNPSDRLRLIEDSGQEMYAKSIALGVANYFNSIKPVEVAKN